jgi:hypothetical protein
VVSVLSLMPTIAISGRWRFGGYKAAIVASASSFDRRHGSCRRRRRQRENPGRADDYENCGGAQAAP